MRGDMTIASEGDPATVVHQEAVQTPKAVVVGAGIIGICTALQLQRAGFETVVLDRQAPGEGASYANGGVVGEQHVAPMAVPGVLRKLPAMLSDRESPLSIRWSYLWQLAPWLVRFVASARPKKVRRVAGAMADLLDSSTAAYDRLLESVGENDMIRRTGWLCVYETARGFAGDAAKRDLEEQLNRDFEVIPAEALRQFEPALGDSQRFYNGVYYGDVGHVRDNYRLIQILARNFRCAGGRILREEASGFEFSDDRVRGVRTNRALHVCDHVVIAAGAWSRALTRQLGDDPPLDTERGYSLTLPHREIAPRMPIYSTERGMVCTPLDTGLRIAGTVEFGGLDAEPDWQRAELLMKHAKRFFPDLDGQPVGHWMGMRPSMPDSLPVISRATRHPNAVFAFGHGHCGLMLGARTGELVRDLVLDRSPPIDMMHYRVDRF